MCARDVLNFVALKAFYSLGQCITLCLCLTEPGPVLGSLTVAARLPGLPTPSGVGESPSELI